MIIDLKTPPNISWYRQFSQIKKEGWAAVRLIIRKSFIKAVKLPIHLIGITPAIPIVLFVRLIQPLVLIRFGPIRSDVLGPSVIDPEYYLSEREVEKSKSIDCFYFQDQDPPNEQWAIMVRRHLRINAFFRYLDIANQLLPGGVVHHKMPCDTGSRDIKGFLARTKPHIKFTSEEDTRGCRFLESLSMQPSDRFICLIARDSAYKEKYQKGRIWGNRDWSYHSYRDSDIDSYEEAALALAEKGYWVFRMGKAVHKPFKAEHPRILDYANSAYRCDFLDIWLMANCFFCITTGTGLDEVSRIFRKPALLVNHLPANDIFFYNHSISLTKHLVWKETGKQLALSEYLAHSYVHSEQYENAKILVEDLTAEEIRQAVLEMEARLNGTWKDSKEDIQLQNRFWETFKVFPDFTKYHGWIHPEARVGAAWLRSQINNFLS